MTKTMRRAAAALAVGGLLSGLAGLVPGTDAQEVVPLPGYVDLTVSIASVPAVVSPPGELVIYEVTVEQGFVPTAGTVTVDLEDGSEYRSDLTEAGLPEGVDCAGSGETVECTFGASAAPVEIEVIAHTAPDAGEQEAVATVAATGPAALLEWEGNNEASATTEVTEQEEGVAAGLVEEGESISLDADDGRSYTLTVPEGVPGVIVTISLEDGTGELCGLGPCEDGFITEFVEDHPIYTADDPENPLVTRKTFAPQGPCYGLGGRCNEIYVAKDSADDTLELMVDCTGRTGGEPGDGDVDPVSPCLNRKYKQGGQTWFEVLMLSIDPVELPPALRL